MKERVLLVVAVLGLILSSAVATHAQESADSTDAVANLGACLAEERALSVVFLIDESASLETTDPEGQRVSAAKAALANLAAVDAEARRRDDPITIDVYLAGFSVDFVDRGDGWTTVDAESRPVLFDQLDEFETLDQGVDTDYVRALRGAAEVLEGQAGCHLVLWFTDGKYDIDPTATNFRVDYDEHTGEDAPAPASRPEYYEQVGRDWLCSDPGNITGLYRENRTFLITSVLSFDDPEEQRFTQRVTEGIDEAGEACGALAERATETGKYQSADDLIDLFFDFETIFWDVRGIRAVDNPVVAPFGTTLVHFSAQLAPSQSEAVIVDPTGERTPIPATSGEFPIGDSTGDVAWGDRTFVLDIEVDQESETGVGTWFLEVGPEDPVQAGIRVELEIVEPFTSDEVRAGEEAVFRSVATNTAGLAPGPDARVGLEAHFEWNGEERSAEWSDDGSFWTNIPIPIDGAGTDLGGLVAVATASSTANGAETLWRFDSDPGAITALEAVTAPTVITRSIDLGTSADGQTAAATEPIIATAGTVDGCVRLVEFVSETDPEAVRSLVWSVETTTTEQCGDDGYLVSLGGEIELFVSAMPEEAAQGRGTGVIAVETSTLDGGLVGRSDVEYSIRYTATPDSTTFWILFFVLLLAGIAWPLFAVWIWGWSSARFASLGLAKVVVGELTVDPVSQTTTLVTQGSTIPLEGLSTIHFRNLGAVGQRHFTTGGVSFRVKSRLAGARGYAEKLEAALAAQGTVGKPGEPIRVPLDLDAVWIWAVTTSEIQRAGNNGDPALRGTFILFSRGSVPDAAETHTIRRELLGTAEVVSGFALAVPDAVDPENGPFDALAAEEATDHSEPPFPASSEPDFETKPTAGPRGPDWDD
jgi:hypothetical protein